LSLRILRPRLIPREIPLQYSEISEILWNEHKKYTVEEDSSRIESIREIRAPTMRRKTSERLCRERGVRQSMKVFVSHVLSCGITMDACASLAAQRISRSMFLQTLFCRVLNRLLFDEALERETLIPLSFLSPRLPFSRFHIINLKRTNMHCCIFYTLILHLRSRSTT